MKVVVYMDELKPRRYLNEAPVLYWNYGSSHIIDISNRPIDEIFNCSKDDHRRFLNGDSPLLKYHFTS